MICFANKLYCIRKLYLFYKTVMSHKIQSRGILNLNKTRCKKKKNNNIQLSNSFRLFAKFYFIKLEKFSGYRDSR